MPTYQYACTSCDQRLEVVQSFSDPALTQCPHCSGRLRKVYGSVGVVFKGSGFYKTDSRAGTGSAKSGTDGGSAGGSGDGGTSTGGTSTPAAATAGSSNGSGNGSSNGSGTGSGKGSGKGSSSTASAPSGASGST